MSPHTTCTPPTAGVNGISASALRALVATMPAIYAESDPRKLPQVFADALSGLVPAESYCVVVRNRQRGDRAWHVRPACLGHEARVPAFFEYISEFAPATHRARTGTGEALALSDFVSNAQMKRLGLYREYYQRVGLEDDLNINVMLDDVVICASAMRSQRGFLREERELMNALRPHFKQAWSNALALTKGAGQARPGSMIEIGRRSPWK